MNVHAKALLRDMICSTLNRHTRGTKPPVGLFGSRRSGTTLLAQILCVSPGLKNVDQPLSVFSADLVQRKFLPAYAGGLIYDPEPSELEKIVDYLDRIIDGQLHVSEPWRPWSPEFHFFSNRILFKFTDAHALADVLSSSLPMTRLALFRHPIAQSLSCIERQWPARGGGIFRQVEFLERHFSAEQVKFIRRSEQDGTELAKMLVCWFVENAPLLRAAISDNTLPYATFEQLVTDPAPTIAAACDWLDITYSEAMLDVAGKPSRSSSRAKSGSEIQSLIASGDRAKIVDRWMAKLTKDQAKIAEEIFDVLNCPLYAHDRAEPISASGGPLVNNADGQRAT